MSLLDDDDAPAKPSVTIMHLMALAARGAIVTYKLDGPMHIFEHAACMVDQMRNPNDLMSTPRYYERALANVAEITSRIMYRECDHCRRDLNEPPAIVER